jgi:ABC-type Na+ efflux pump permease subunit
VRFLWSTALKDLRRLRRDPFALGLWIGIPILVGFLIILATGGKSGPKPQAHLLVADNDGSMLSKLLVGAMDQGPAAELIRAEKVDEPEGRARMDKGEASALLIIPKGFGERVLKDEPVTLTLLTNPAQQILPGIVKEYLGILTDAAFYLHRLIGEDLKAFAEGPPPGETDFSDARIAEFSVKMKHLSERLHKVLFPPVIEVESTVEKKGGGAGKQVSPGVLFVPGLLFMSLLFMAQGLSMDLWHERDGKTLRRAAAAPQSLAAFLAGKMLAGAFLMLGVSIVALAAGYGYFSLPVTTFVPAVFWAVFSGLLLLVGMMVIQLLATSARMGSILTMCILFPLMMAGGSFFPFEAMPGWLAAVGKRTPNGWALEILKNIILQRVEPHALAAALAGLSAAALLLFAIAARRLRSRAV